MKKSIIFVALLGLVFTSCEKSFYDINVNPNNPTGAQVTNDMLLAQALHETGRIQIQSYSSLEHWMQHWSRGGDYGPSAELESYNITNNFLAGTWNLWYNNLNDYNIVVTRATGTDQHFYEAAARTMKTIGFMYLVDSYGNVPYTQAFNLSTYITPAYDKGPDIYKSLLSELDKAMAQLDLVVPGADTKFEQGDIMFKGNVTKWKKFVNTQRLRLVLRLSNTGVIAHATELAKVTADGYLMQGETAAVNPGYAPLTNQQNPFWDSYKLSAAGIVIDKFNRASNYTLNNMKTIPDIRYQYVFEPALIPVSGNTYYGYNFGQNLPNSDPYKSDNSSGVAGKGLAKSAAQAQWIITSVESMFLQAEAKQKGYIGGNAENAFYDAIRESFSWLGVTNALTEANNYIASGHAFVNWAGAANKTQLIITQKYYSMVGMAPFEVWTDYRRTGFPNVPLTVAANAGPNIPVRLRYPQIEYNYNPANVAAEGDPSPFTGKIFWDL